MNTTPIPETSASKAFADQGGVECDPASAGSTDDSSSGSSSTSSGTSSDSSSSSDGSSSEASDSSDGEAAYWRPARNCLTTKPQADQPGTTFAPSRAQMTRARARKRTRLPRQSQQVAESLPQRKTSVGVGNYECSTWGTDASVAGASGASDSWKDS